MTVLIPAVSDFASRRAYVQSLHHVEVWRPYVSAVLSRHGLPVREPVAGHVGKYPTFLVGDVVVKLFGRFPSWRNDHAVELLMQQRLSNAASVLAPALLDHGSLYDSGDEPWPYMITQRLRGIAWRDAVRLDYRTRGAIAARLGELVHDLHEIPIPAESPFDDDRLTQLRRNCATRLATDATLPQHLQEQVGDYLVESSERRVLTHGDLTEDHLFVKDHSLVGVIDWGDAQATDPTYDLPPLHLGAFNGDQQLLRSFLAGYGWKVDDQFAHRALSLTLTHRKSEYLLRRLASAVDLDSCSTLTDLADAVWTVEL